MAKMSNFMKINNLYRKTRKEALHIIIGEAINIMQNHPVYTEFWLGMGTCYFKSGDVAIAMDNMPCCAEEIRDILSDWEDRLCLTGENICVYPDGKIVK